MASGRRRFFSGITFPPLPKEVYFRYKTIKTTYGLSAFHMLVLMVLAMCELGQTNQGRLNQLAVDASQFKDPWNKVAEEPEQSV